MLKRMMIIGLGVHMTVLMCGFCAADELMTRAQMLFKPIPREAPPLKDNVLSPEKIDLGRMLYFDPRLSASGLISCNTCHNVGLAGANLQETAVGHGWQKGGRNSPTVFNAIFNLAQFWDGRAQDLKEQAKGPPQAAIEMNSTPDLVVETVKSMPLVEQVALRALFCGENALVFVRRDAALGFELRLGPEFRRQHRDGKPAQTECQIMQPPEVMRFGHFASLENAQNILGVCLHQTLAPQGVKGFGLHGSGTAGLRGGFAVRLHLIHDGLPGSGAHDGITCRQVSPGDLNVEARLPERFVPGVQQNQGFALVLV